MATKRKAQDAKIEDALAKKMGKNNPATPPDTKSARSAAKQAAQDVPEGEGNNQPTAAPEAAEATKAANVGAPDAEQGTKKAEGTQTESGEANSATQPDNAKPAAIKPAPGHALVTYTGYVNMRAAPSTAARIAGRVGRGNRLEVLGIAEGDGHTWYALPGGLYIMADAGLLNFYPR